MECTRPILVEIQALVAPSLLGTPRRAALGWDPNRLAMLLAVLEARCGVRLGSHDVYLNVAGGLRLQEPAADLAAAAALISSLTGKAAPEDNVYFGEVSLSGAVRPVAQAALRLSEAERLGFTQAVLPAGSAGSVRSTLALNEVTTLADIVAETTDTGAEAIYVVADVGDREQVEAIAQAAMEQYGRIDTWINDAGGSIYGRLHEVSEEVQAH